MIFYFIYNFISREKIRSSDFDSRIIFESEQYQERLLTLKKY